MNSFSAQWLQLREPLDAAARAAGLATFLSDYIAEMQRQGAPLPIVDLGAGTGANLRYLAPLVRGSQDWLLVERDALLIRAAQDRLREWAAPPQCRIGYLELDLATRLQALPLPQGVLITASALLDLVSETWLRELARRAAAAAAGIWFALSFDGRMDCAPAEPEDAPVRELFNLHQLNDKGFGPALGPKAARMAEEIFQKQGYHIRSAPSDWHIGPQSADLQFALIQGWFEAASEVAPHRTSMLRGWLARRRAHIEAGRSELRIGHVDTVGHPPRQAN